MQQKTEGLAAAVARLIGRGETVRGAFERAWRAYHKREPDPSELQIIADDAEWYERNGLVPDYMEALAKTSTQFSSPYAPRPVVRTR